MSPPPRKPYPGSGSDLGEEDPLGPDVGPDADGWSPNAPTLRPRDLDGLGDGAEPWDSIPPPPPAAQPRGSSSPEPGGPRRARRIIAIGGGRGGVGKTLLTVNLGVYLAQLGRNVAICDADPFGSGMHTMLGLHQPPLAVTADIAEGRALPVDTTVPGLKLVPAAYDRTVVAPKSPRRMSHWLAQIAEVDVDYVVLNLGASSAPARLDMFQEADVSICMTVPEPTAIGATYRFMRALFARSLRRALIRDRIKQRVVERALAGLPPLPAPRDVVTQIARFDNGIANLAAALMARLRPALVVGKTRLRRDLDLGPSMCSLSERYLGVAIEYLGHVEYDDAVWHTARRQRPLLTDAPTSKSARDIERVARRILAKLATPHDRGEPEPAPGDNLLGRIHAPMTLYDVLGAPRTAVDEEIRRAYRLQREIFREESLPIVSLVDEAGVRAEQAQIEEAHDTLLDPIRKRAYDLSTFPDDDHAGRTTGLRRRAMSEDELAYAQAELAREITAETQFSGNLLRRAREALGMEIDELAQLTKISPFHLRAIEADDFEAMPAQVYVSGFLKLIAKVLGLDPMQVAKTFLQRKRAAEQARSR